MYLGAGWSVKPSLIWVRRGYLEEFLLVGLFLLEVFGDGYAGVPLFLAESEVVGVDELVYLFLDAAGVERDVVFGEELFLLIVVDLVIAYRPDFGLPVLLGSQQPSEIVFLHGAILTSFLSRR
jgi:hypothetical protein